MPKNGVLCSATSMGKPDTPFCILTTKAEPSCSKLCKSRKFDGTDCSKSCCIAGHVSILWAAEACRYGKFLPLASLGLGCVEGRIEEVWYEPGLGSVSSTETEGPPLEEDACCGPKFGTGPRIGIRSTFVSRAFRRSRISTRVLSFLVGCGSRYLHSSFILWHRPHFGRCSSHLCFLDRQVSQAWIAIVPRRLFGGAPELALEAESGFMVNLTPSPEREVQELRACCTRQSVDIATNDYSAEKLYGGTRNWPSTGPRVACLE